MVWDYEKQKAYMAAKNNAASKAGRDIEPIPKVKNAKRKAACQKDLKKFLETYFPNTFTLNWSNDHLKVIQLVQSAIVDGGQFSMALPRGSGKTSICVDSAIWAILYGHRKFPVLIGSTETAADELLEQIESELEYNELLNEDFPEVCYPIRKLEGIRVRQAGQLFKGKPTGISITAKEIIFPNIPKAKSSGALIRVAGITGRIRGMSAVLQNGRKIRPDLVIVDDPQTEESAHSPQQTQRRLSTINGAILGLAGPGEKIACFTPITVIQKDDLADKLLDRKVYPQWQGIRCKLLNSLPTNLKAWEQYAEIRADGLRQEKGLQPATEYYLAHQQELDEGAVAAWEDRFNSDEASAIQHAMNKKLDDELSFWAEYQNEPLSILLGEDVQINSEALAMKVLDNLPRGKVKANTVKMTAFIDVQKEVLFWMVCCWDNNFSGHIVDYGTYPEQPNTYFTLSGITRTISNISATGGFDNNLYAALKELSDRLLNKAWFDEHGESHKISRLMIDANWGQSTNIVHRVAKQSVHRTLILPSHGVGIGPDKKPFNEYRPEEGIRVGWNWRNNVKDNHIRYDTNSWKTFGKNILLAGPGESASVTIAAGTIIEHRLLFEQLASEYNVRVTNKEGKPVDIWKLKPVLENHLLDCFIGCCVGAGEQGVKAFGHSKDDKEEIKRKKKKLSVQF